MKPNTLELLTPEQTRPIDQHWSKLMDQSQADSWDPAHGRIHLTSVALLTDPWGARYGLSSHYRLGLRNGGYGHDRKRSASEIALDALNDARESAEFVYGQLVLLKEVGILKLTDTAMQGVKYAIATHDTSPWKVGEEGSRNKPGILSLKLREVLFLADRMEQIDADPAVIRRSMFVAGKRREIGDLSSLTFSKDPDKSKLEAFLQESVIRVTFSNSEQSFPQHVNKILAPIYVAQKEFIHALCKNLGINSTEALARFILGIQDSQGRNVLDLRQIKYPSSPDELAKVIEEKGGINTKAVEASTTDAAESAAETILYLSSNWRNQNPEEVIDIWRPVGDSSKRFQEGFANYVSGKWAIDTQQKILLAA